MITADGWRHPSSDESSEPEAAWLDDVSRIYAEHHQALVRFAALRAGGGESAEDVVHEAFARLVREGSRGAMPDEPLAWLHRVVCNILVSQGRHRSVVARRARVVAPDDEGPPDDVVIEQERARSLRQALAQLPPDARRAVMLAANGYSGLEIASELGRTHLGTRALLWRSRARLRSLLSEPVLAGS